MMPIRPQRCRAGGRTVSSLQDNTWLTDQPSRAAAYLAIADLVLVERARIATILVDVFRYHFDGRRNLSLLDLGCGDVACSPRTSAATTLATRST